MMPDAASNKMVLRFFPISVLWHCASLVMAIVLLVGVLIEAVISSPKQVMLMLQLILVSLYELYWVKQLLRLKRNAQLIALSKNTLIEIGDGLQSNRAQVQYFALVESSDPADAIKSIECKSLFEWNCFGHALFFDGTLFSARTCFALSTLQASHPAMSFANFSEPNAFEKEMNMSETLSLESIADFFGSA